MRSDFESQTHLLVHAYYNHITYFHHDVFGLSYLDELWIVVIVIHQNRSFWDTFTPNLAITPSDVTVRSCHFTQFFPDLLSQNYIPIIVSHHSTIFHVCRIKWPFPFSYEFGTPGNPMIFRKCPKVFAPKKIQPGNSQPSSQLPAPALQC